MYNFCAAKVKGYIATRLAVKKKELRHLCSLKICIIIFIIFFLILVSFITIFYHFTFLAK